MSFATRATDVPEYPRKGECLWIDGKPYYYGHRYQAFVSLFGCRVEGRLSWAAVANPVPVLLLDEPTRDDVRGSTVLHTQARPAWWSGLTYLGE